MISPPASARPRRARPPLPAAVSAPAGELTPIVGVGAGGHAKMGTTRGDYVIAFALPRAP